MKTILFVGSLICAMSAFGDDIRPGAPVNYSCSADQTMLMGSDGSSRNCGRFRCISQMCETFCNNTSECTSGTCDVPTGRCI